jgi:hypothetical protein
MRVFHTPPSRVFKIVREWCPLSATSSLGLAIVGSALICARLHAAIILVVAASSDGFAIIVMAVTADPV